MRNTKILSMLLVAIISSFFLVNKVNAYFISDDSANNIFTIAQAKTLTKEYYVLDENNQQISVETTTTEAVFDGEVININDTLTSYDCDSIDHYINGQLYNANTYTINGNTTVKEVCVLNTYTITYNLDGGTISNEPTIYSSYTPTFNLPTPTRDGYFFEGWCIGSNCSDPYTIIQGSTGSINVTANWREKQKFTVRYTGETENYSYTGALTAEEGSTYTSTITATGGYGENQIDTVTVRMNGNVVQNAWDSTNRRVTVTNVSGPIEINVTTNCLIEGTKIMLWDGSTKNVEDITYNDLLKVWNHETGTYGYEYPAWIEKAGKVSKYTKVTFSDGTELKIASDHRLFSRRLNKYVNVNSGELHIGDEVVSLKNGVSYVSIVNIETVYEEANYYHVITTRYFNMIAEGLLTTYEINDEISSNYKGFDSDMKWVNYTPEDRKMSYEEVLNTFGYVDKYLYKAMKIEDFRYAVEQGYISQEELGRIIEKYMRKDDFKIIPPTNDEGQYLWMVTTSDDINPSSPLHQMVEGEMYTVPTPNNEENFLYWYNHSDNKYYQPGDQIEVDSSMYLEAIYN